ncbi:MAG: 4-Cys prefix domain-containing protein, partial [Cyanobacteria bacterium P01_A01_bin.70]
MSLCINPSCPQPAHPNNSHTLTCQACGSELLLQGQYRVMRLLSKNSGFGLVYEAYQRDIPKILKVLKP